MSKNNSFFSFVAASKVLLFAFLRLGSRVVITNKPQQISLRSLVYFLGVFTIDRHPWNVLMPWFQGTGFQCHLMFEFHAFGTFRALFDISVADL